MTRTNNKSCKQNDGTAMGVRRVGRYQRGNQNPYIEEEQTNTMAKRKSTKGQTTINKLYR